MMRLARSGKVRAKVLLGRRQRSPQDAIFTGIDPGRTYAMKTSPPCSSRFALLLASAALTAARLGWGAPPPAADVTPAQMIDAFEGTFGVHPGQRRNHIKGTCAAGQFIGTPEA